MSKYLFDYEVLKPVKLKGIDYGVKIFKPIKLREKPELKRGIHGIYSPLTGRDNEFNLLIADLEGMDFLDEENGEYNGALKELQSSLKISEEIEDKKIFGGALLLLARLNFAKNEWEEAKSISEKSEKIGARGWLKKF